MSEINYLLVLASTIFLVVGVAMAIDRSKWKREARRYERKEKAEQEALDDIWRKEPWAFVKRPVKIHAARVEDIDPEFGIALRSRTYGDQEWPKWFTDAFNKGDIVVGRKDGGNVLYVKTLEGEHVIRPGMWIICGIKGELYGCQDDIFADTYE